MIKEVFITQGRTGKTILEYTLFAFQTQKGIFTLVGTEIIQNDAIDTFRNIQDGTFHEWKRSTVNNWLKKGKIIPIQEATELTWFKDRKRGRK